MKEIHAYQNEDGTYRVEIIGAVKSSRFQQGIGWIDEVVQSTTEIQRASIQTTAYVFADNEEKMVTLTLDGGKDG